MNKRTFCALLFAMLAFAADSYDKGPVTVEISRDAGIWGNTLVRDITLLSAPKGINTNAVTFAPLPRGGRFIYLPKDAEKPTSLVFRPPRGFMLILK